MNKLTLLAALIALSLASVANGKPCSRSFSQFNCQCETDDIEKHVLIINCNGTANATQLFQEINDYLKNLTSLKHVKELQIQNAQLHQVPPALCNLTKIIDLNLDSNNLTSLPPDCLTNMTQLHTLSAASNQITSLPDGLFSDLHNLQRISLQNNRLEDVPKEFSNKSELTSLEEINLEYNNFTSLDAWPFIRAQVLDGEMEFRAKLFFNHISIFNNTIPDLNLNDCELHSKFKLNLRLGRNSVVRGMDLVDGFKFKSMKNFACLFNPISEKMGYNVVFTGIYACDCLDYPFLGYIYKYNIGNEIPIVGQIQCPSKHTSNKTSISLERYRLINVICDLTNNSLCPNDCDCIQRPKNKTFHVQCQNRSINSMPEKLPESGSSQYKLEFRGNYGFKLEAKTYFANTTFLDVSDCGIKEISDDTWKGLMGIKKVWLYGNQLRTLPKFLIKENSSFQELRIYNNTWNCGCDNRWLKGYFKKLGTVLLHAEEILCSFPARLKGKAILHLDDEEFCFDPVVKMLVITLSSVVLGLILIGILFFLMHRFRIKMHSVWHIHPFDRDECQGEEMDFDVFISFAEHDLQVSRKLLSFLEEKHYKVCYHQRDFEVGETIDNNICNAIFKSKRTLCLISRNFIHSQYAMREFDVALDRNIKLRKKRLIMVLLETVEQLRQTSDEAAVSLVQYLESHTYVEYASKDFEARLLYAMPMRSLRYSTIETRIIDDYFIANGEQMRNNDFGNTTVDNDNDDDDNYDDDICLLNEV